MKNVWTKEQQEAIGERNENFLVAAAAGAGKTAVLVERIIQRITDELNPADIDRLLVVTFTNAAATEMRERIGEAISKALEANPGSKLLKRQMVLLGKSSITTIHSFCLEVIRNNFQYIDLDPNFRIADETEALLLKMEALDELFESLYTVDAEYQDNSGEAINPRKAENPGKVENSGGTENSRETENPGKAENLGNLEDKRYAIETPDKKNQDFMELLESYGGNRDDLKIQNMVLQLYNFVQSDPWPQKWLDSRSEMFNPEEGTDFCSSVWGKLLAENAGAELEGMCIMLKRAIDICDDADGLESYIPALRDDLDALGELLEICRGSMLWDKIAGRLGTMEFSRFARCGKDADKVKQELVKNIRDNVKKKIKVLSGDVFYAPSEEIIRELKCMYPLIKCLCRLVAEFGLLYREKKKSRQLLDFNDLEHLCLQILTASPAANAYRERFEEILVDEYQDSNLVQDIIIKTISRMDDGKPNIFMVGDVKQSIYRFRQAKPELFLDKYNTYSADKGTGFRKILLYKNFRSRAEVVDGVNYIFKQIMSAAAGELDYTDDEALNLGAVFEAPGKPGVITGGPIEVHIAEPAANAADGADAETGFDEGTDADYNVDNLNNDRSGSYEGETENGLEAENGGAAWKEGLETELPGSVQCEAEIAAKRITELMQPDAEGRRFMVWDKSSKTYRVLEYRDIVILLRATKNWAGIYLEELSANGIPAYADTGTGFFMTVEVQIMLSLLQVIDNPRQDIALLSVLRSPIAYFTQDELADLRLQGRQICIYDALKLLAADGKKSSDEGKRNSADGKKNSADDSSIIVAEDKDVNPAANGTTKVALKAAEFLDKLERWRDAAFYKSTDELIWYLYSDTGFFNYAGAMPAGVQRQANLRLLYERARQFEETSYRGLFNFIRFIDKLKSGRGDMGSAKILGENENVVRIMSIHKSKGLEFPVVILAGCGKGFNLQDMNRNMLFHQELGFGPDYVDYRLRLSHPSAAKQAIRCRIKTESLSEEMRILYVAFTRAREKLIITGSVSSLEKASMRWCQIASSQESKLPGFEVLQGKCYFDWVIPALLRHRECGGLRDLLQAGEPGIPVDDPSCWAFRLWDGNELAAVSRESRIDESSIKEQLEKLDLNITYSDKWVEIQRRLCWKYPYQKLSAIPAKLSVTELKRMFAMEFNKGEASAANSEFVAPDIFTVADSADKPVLMKRPLFLEGTRGLSAAEAGTALHYIMQHISLDKLKRRNSGSVGVNVNPEFSFKDLVVGQIKHMVEEEMLTTQQAEAVDVMKIVRWFSSTLGGRMLAASKVERELPFNLQIAASEIFEDAGEEDGLLLQGVIDCCFEESDGMVLIDYKTDYAPEERMGELKEKYRLQIAYYKRAIEQLTGKKVKESYVYLFWNGRVIEY